MWQNNRIEVDQEVIDASGSKFAVGSKRKPQ